MSGTAPTLFRDSQPLLGLHQTQDAITLIKEVFPKCLAKGLNLRRIAAPLVLPGGDGINDDLTGIERPVTFPVPGLNGARVEIPQSLAKWKRMALADLAVPPGCGILTDMHAIRPDETLDELHSIYVDQWDWERTIRPEERSIIFLQRMVREIYSAIRDTEEALARQFPALEACLPDEITVLHADDLARENPEMPPRHREDVATRRHGAVFLAGIGAPLCDGRPHDGRAPDYDDWITPNGSRCSAPLSFPPWASGLPPAPSWNNWLSTPARSGRAISSTGACWQANYPVAWEVESASRACVCSCCARSTSARCR